MEKISLIKKVSIEDSWKRVLAGEFDKEYFKHLSDFVRNEYMQKIIYPSPKDIFKAFWFCPFNSVKVVIIGQDPYHGAHQANGLSFAVAEDTPLPPSLKNIFLEVESDVGITPMQNGDLSRWAEQGVFLLNATLTVRAQSPGSHQKKGWETFTDSVINHLSEEREHLVFILWGNYAKKKGDIIDRKKHCVLESAHPSPFSAHSGFLGSKPFSKTNRYLQEHGIESIDWK